EEGLPPRHPLPTICQRWPLTCPVITRNRLFLLPELHPKVVQNSLLQDGALLHAEPSPGPASRGWTAAVPPSLCWASPLTLLVVQVGQLLTQPAVDGCRAVLDPAILFHVHEPLPQLAIDAEGDRNPVAQLGPFPPADGTVGAGHPRLPGREAEIGDVL